MAGLVLHNVPIGDHVSKRYELSCSYEIPKKKLYIGVNHAHFIFDVKRETLGACFCPFMLKLNYIRL